MLSDAIGGIAVRVPAYGAQIATQCAQLRALRDKQGARARAALVRGAWRVGVLQ